MNELHSLYMLWVGHIWTCPPLFHNSGATWRIVLKYGVLYPSALHFTQFKVSAHAYLQLHILWNISIRFRLLPKVVLLFFFYKSSLEVPEYAVWHLDAIHCLGLVSVQCLTSLGCLPTLLGVPSLSVWRPPDFRSVVTSHRPRPSSIPWCRVQLVRGIRCSACYCPMPGAWYCELTPGIVAGIGYLLMCWSARCVACDVMHNLNFFVLEWRYRRGTDWSDDTAACRSG